MKWHKVKRTIYPATVYFCTGGTIETLKAKLKRLKLTPDEDIDSKMNKRGEQLGWTLKMTTADNKFAILIWIGKIHRNPREISVLTHECEHACFYIFEYIGMQMPCHSCQECATYLLDYLVEEGLKFFWKPQLYEVSL